MQIACNTVLPPAINGVDGDVVYIDTVISCRFCIRSCDMSILVLVLYIQLMMIINRGAEEKRCTLRLFNGMKMALIFCLWEMTDSKIVRLFILCTPITMFLHGKSLAHPPPLSICIRCCDAHIQHTGGESYA